ncbi:MAG: phosphatase PAP2 family protein [Bacteroidales bacterium]|nr:phosphatase PAP2 family protein [Bacteroidales bacterium]
MCDGKKSVVVLLILLSSIVKAQVTDDSLQVKERKFEYNLSLKNTIVPVVLITYGIVGFNNPKLKSWNVDTRDEVLEDIDRKYHIDDYFQYVPSVTVYFLDDAGLKAKHSFWDRTAILASSFVLQTMVVQTLKYTTKVERPDSSNMNSFPSGHTTLAFSGAEFLWQEYKEHSIWIGVAGYAVASSIGIARVINNKHWLTDVFAGAGIGILSTKISYFFYERIKLKPRRGNRTYTMITPIYGNKINGLTLSVRF